MTNETLEAWPPSFGRRRSFKRRMMVTLAILIPLCAGTCIFGPISQTIPSDGYKDLEITLQVKDAVTGKPIPDAKIEVLCDDSAHFPDVKMKIPFTMTTAFDGRVVRLCQHCETFGRSGGFTMSFYPPGIHLVDEWHLRLPEWLVQVSASGYKSLEAGSIATPAASQRVERGDDFARVQIDYELQPEPAPKAK